MIIMNRNTSPVSPFRAEHYEKTRQATPVNQYPEVEIDRFKKNYGEISGLNPEQLELANGSDEWIQKLMIVFGQDGGALTLAPDFFMYTDYADQIGVDLRYVDSDDNYNFDIQEVIRQIKEIKPRMFIFSNPQNPTGTQFSEEEIQYLADAMQEIDGYLVIDEAYIEFGEEYERPQGDHVIIIRTMSKIYGMAGLRIGILHATGATYDKVTKINHPYPLNNLVLNLASEFLEDQPVREAFIDYQLEAKKRLVESLNYIEDVIQVKPSATNFVFTYGDKAADLGRYLEKEGYLPRFYEEDNLKDVVRYSIIGLEDYPRFEEAVKNWRAMQ